MKTYLENIVLLSKSAHRNMIRSVAEHLLEPTGYLIGERIGRNIHIFTTYHIQTSIRKPSKVSYGNENAIKRIRNFENVWKDGGTYLGGFHAHIIGKANNPVDISQANTLSDEDLDFIKHEMKKMKKDRWIEIIMKLEEKTYRKKHEVEEVITPKHRKLNSRIYDTPHHGYLITFSAYSINKDGITTSLKIRDEIIDITRRGYAE